MKKCRFMKKEDVLKFKKNISNIINFFDKVRISPCNSIMTKRHNMI